MTDETTRRAMRYFVVFLKLAAPIAIIVWLMNSIDEDQLLALQQRQKNWWLLGAAFSLTLAAVCLSFFRWYLLVRTLDIPFRARDAFRLGFLGYLFNFISVGSVGGDLFKAVFIAREQSTRRAEAVATVIVDRMFGLYGLLLLTCIAILLGLIDRSVPSVNMLCNMTVLATLLGSIAILMVLVPGFTSGVVSETLANLPRIGPLLETLISAVRMFRNRLGAILAICGISLVVHGLIVLAMVLAGKSLFNETPSVPEHFVIIPLSNVVSAIPFTPAGLGTYEFAMEKLYQLVPQNEAARLPGVLLALVFRVMTIGVAAVGVVYYWTSHAEVQDLLRRAREERTAAKAVS